MSSEPTPRARRPSALGPSARRELAAFGEAFFADDDGPPDRAHLDWTLDELGQMLAHAGLRARLLFSASLLTLTYLVPLILLWTPRRFSSLTPGDRLEALHRAETSPAGLAVFLIRALISLAYYEHERGAAAIGWDRTCLVARPPAAVQPAEEHAS